MSHSTFARRLAIITALAVAIIVTLAVTTADARVHCTEDSPTNCWNWATMGNLDRGVRVVKGAPKIGTRAIHDRRVRIVSPCEFALLDFIGAIDWKHTEHIKGDSFARKHGCNPRLYA